MGVDHAGRTPANEETSLFLDDESRESAPSCGGSWIDVGYFIGPFLAHGDALFSDRTLRTLRLARCANHGAQFHQRLIEVRTVSLAWPVCSRGGPDQVLREPPEPGVGLLSARIFGDAEEAGQHANDIAVKRRHGVVEGDAADRAGRVTTDARQRQYLVELFRKPSPMPIDNDPRGLLKI